MAFSKGAEVIKYILYIFSPHFHTNMNNPVTKFLNFLPSFSILNIYNQCSLENLKNLYFKINRNLHLTVSKTDGVDKGPTEGTTTDN